MTSIPLTTATEIAAGVRTGRVSASDVVTAALARITARDDRIGAFQVVRAAKAAAEAAEVAGRADVAQLPLAGVPIAIKDNVPVAGEPMRGRSSPANGRSPIGQQNAHHRGNKRVVPLGRGGVRLPRLVAVARRGTPQVKARMAP